MKKIKLVLLSAIFIFTSATYATTLPGYYVGTQFLGGTYNGNTNYAQALFVGYQYNCYWALEGAVLTDFSSTKANSYQIYSVLAKAMLPFGTGFDIFAKAGLGYVTPGNVANIVAPIVGAGVSYDITSQLVVDATYNHLNNTATVNDINYYGIGLSYHFC